MMSERRSNHALFGNFVELRVNFGLVIGRHETFISRISTAMTCMQLRAVEVHEARYFAVFRSLGI